MAKKANIKSNKDNNSKANPKSDIKVSRIVEQMTAQLKRGDFKKAAKLFITGQSRGIFAAEHNLTGKLVKVIGKNATSKLITAFAHYPCPFCKKGRIECKSCQGHGHSDHEIICEQCLGLGVARCDFCDGSGWMALEDVPKGLQITILVKRAQTALNRLKSILAKPIPQISKNKPSTTLKKCAQLLISLDRYMGVLENSITATRKLTISEPRFKNKIAKIIRSSLKAAMKGKEHKRKIIQRMVNSARRECATADEDSDAKKLAEKRVEFYKILINESDTFMSLSEDHPFLEKALKKYASKKTR